MSYLIKDLPNESKPRERFLERGKEALSNEELIAIILRTGTKNVSAKVLADNIICEIKGIKNLKNISVNELSKIKGIGQTKAITLLAGVELGKRVYLEHEIYNQKIINSMDIYNLFKDSLKFEFQEKLIVVLLNNKKCIIKSKVIFIGTINASVVHPREIFKEAIKESASSIILIHNHPSGDSTPSKNDDTFSIQMKSTGELLEIPLMDHIIIGHNNYYSYNDNNWG